MSCDWGYHCRTCNEGKSSDTWWNHGEEGLRSAFRVWPHVKVLREAGYTVEGDADYHTRPAWYFLEDHADHDICLIDECGRFEEIQPGMPRKRFVHWWQVQIEAVDGMGNLVRCPGRAYSEAPIPTEDDRHRWRMEIVGIGPVSFVAGWSPLGTELMELEEPTKQETNEENP